MALSEELKKAEKLLDKSDYIEASKVLNDILKSYPTCHRALLLLTQCLMRQKSYDLALEISDELLNNAFEIGKGDYIYEACKVRSMYHYRLKEFDESFKWIVIALKYNHSSDNEGPIFKNMIVRNWIKKGGMTEDEINEKENDILSNWREPSSTVAKSNLDLDIKPSETIKSKEEPSKTKPLLTPEPLPAPTNPKRQVFRHDWYDSNNEITISIYIKRINAQSVESTLSAKGLELKFLDDNGFEYQWTTTLSHTIDTEKSSFKVYGTKLEYTLVKQDNKIHWISLGEESVKDEVDETPSLTSFSKTIDWSKVDEAKEDEEEADPDAFFKKLYAGADENTRRAMMKSYTESNGTSLSMNWDEVGSKEWAPYESKDDN